MNIIELLIDHLPTLLALIATGIFAGILAGLLGVGGGIVIVPVLFFYLSGFWRFTGIRNDCRHGDLSGEPLCRHRSAQYAHTGKKGNVDVDLLKRWSLFILIGVLAGSWLVTRADGTWLTVLFGVIATLSALNMLFQNRKISIISCPAG